MSNLSPLTRIKRGYIVAHLGGKPYRIAYNTHCNKIYTHEAVARFSTLLATIHIAAMMKQEAQVIYEDELGRLRHANLEHSGNLPIMCEGKIICYADGSIEQISIIDFWS